MNKPIASQFIKFGILLVVYFVITILLDQFGIVVSRWQSIAIVVILFFIYDLVVMKRTKSV